MKTHLGLSSRFASFSRIIVLALFAIATSIQGYAQLLWNDTGAPSFAITIPSAAGGPVVYDYAYVAAGGGGNSFPLWSAYNVYTSEYGLVNGAVVRNQAIGEQISHHTREHTCLDTTVTTSILWAFTPPAVEPIATAADSAFLSHSTPIRYSITGPGIIYGWYEYNYYTSAIPDTSGCSLSVDFSTGIWYKLHLELAAGAAPPTLPNPGSLTYQNTAGAVATVTIRKTGDASSDYFGGTYNGSFRVTRCGDTSSPLTVYFAASGTAASGADYNPIGSSVVIPAGQAYANIAIVPPRYEPGKGNKSLTLTLQANPFYTIAAGGSACDPNGRGAATATIFGSK